MPGKLWNVMVSVQPANHTFPSVAWEPASSLMILQNYFLPRKKLTLYSEYRVEHTPFHFCPIADFALTWKNQSSGKNRETKKDCARLICFFANTKFGTRCTVYPEALSFFACIVTFLRPRVPLSICKDYAFVWALSAIYSSFFISLWWSSFPPSRK